VVVVGDARGHEDWAWRRQVRDGDGSGVQKRCSWVPFIVPGVGRRNSGVWCWWSFNGGRWFREGK
jgi:hypothetical protein